MEQMVKCPNCGVENHAGQQFCGKCGAKLAAVVLHQPMIKCPNCGVQNLAGQQFCGNCGTKLAAVAQQAPTAPTPQMPADMTQEAPPTAMRPVTPRQQFEVKPTWGLAWGLWWRMAILGLLIGGIAYLIVVIVMVLGFNYKLPFGT